MGLLEAIAEAGYKYSSSIYPVYHDLYGIPEAPRFANIKFIQYDFKKYGSSEERKRLLSKWDNEVSSLPQ